MPDITFNYMKIYYSIFFPFKVKQSPGFNGMIRIGGILHEELEMSHNH